MYTKPKCRSFLVYNSEERRSLYIKAVNPESALLEAAINTDSWEYPVEMSQDGTLFLGVFCIHSSQRGI